MKKYNFIATLYFIFASILMAGQEMLELEEIGGYIKSIHVDGDAYFVIADNRSFLKYSTEGDSRIVKGGQIVRGDKEGGLELIHRHASLTLKPLPKSENAWLYEAVLLVDRRSFGGELITKTAVVLVNSKYGVVGYTVMPKEKYNSPHAETAFQPDVQLGANHSQDNVLRADIPPKSVTLKTTGKNAKILFWAVVFCSLFVIVIVILRRLKSRN